MKTDNNMSTAGAAAVLALGSVLACAVCAIGAPQLREPAEQTLSAADSIALAQADSLATVLGDVEVTAQRKLVVSDGAKLTYSVADDPESGNSSILEILRKVPGVTVDAEDNVRVNGQSSFKILLNNREDPMLKGDIKNVLKSMPAASIKKIEVISEPGARYEAEGAGGILNIVTDASANLSGFMTNVQGWISPSNVGGNVTGKVKLDKVMLGASASYNDGKVFRRHRHAYSERENLTDGADHYQTSYTRNLNTWDYVWTNLNMSWEPDTLNLFTLSANYSRNGWNGTAREYRTLYGRDYDPEDPRASVIWELARNMTAPGNYESLGTEASYQHSFGRPDHTLVLSYMFDWNRSNSNNSFVSDILSGNPGISPFYGTFSKSYGTSHVTQLDYSNRFGKRHLFEAGAKASINHSRQNSYARYGEDAASAAIDETQRVNVAQLRDIYALYSSYTGTFSKLGVKAGLRYEMSRMGLRYRAGDFPDFTTPLHDLVPNAALSWNFTDASSLRLAYQMRISRPGLGALNPYVVSGIPGEVHYGNPDLKSEKSHNVTLGYSDYNSSVSGGIKLSYRYSDNQITDVISNSGGLFRSTYANVGVSHMAELEVNGDWSITNNLRWSVYLSGTYRYFKSDTEMLRAKKCGWQCYANTNVNYTMPCKVRLSGYAGYYTPWIDLQSRGSSGYYYGLSASRSFLKDDALTLSAGLNNILPVSRSSHYTQQSETVRYVGRWDYKQWSVNFGIAWRFGGLKTDVKRTAASVQKDEVSSGGDKGGK